ncbi:2-oxoacid:acceptor oxidoreductase family protein [Mahella sp.]|uniref:2-oxoacid:acceptor oxidoreductase family protein n=1 Tax=Mahella sp. TaxID=2798721 RepID=UPI0025C0AF91|nr:2-oxoacid:acceptor oxidoreductase family protein [Mahella sp.]MBZ4665384.1 Pyruvate/ketoisovalerate oxidoreductase, catalytic domain protein [Mahella sp.]MDK2902791.1 2-oxoglutarate ferredoxin oxidoreductase subunit gamma [Clostridiales bacterium]
MTHEVIMAGFGGQGVMSIGQLLTHAGMEVGLNVSWYPSYGPEMRGGTAFCHVIVSDEFIGSPLVTSPTDLIIMNRPSLDKFEQTAASGASVFVNSSLIDREVKRDDIKAYYIPANDIANRLGNVRVANMVMFGAFLACTGIAPVDVVELCFKEMLGPSKAHMIDVNRKALREGMKLVDK